MWLYKSQFFLSLSSLISKIWGQHHFLCPTMQWLCDLYTEIWNFQTHNYYLVIYQYKPCFVLQKWKYKTGSIINALSKINWSWWERCQNKANRAKWAGRGPRQIPHKEFQPAYPCCRAPDTILTDVWICYR